VKSESESRESQLRRSATKTRPMYLMLTSNDTVPISVCRGGCIKCRVVIKLHISNGIFDKFGYISESETNC